MASGAISGIIAGVRQGEDKDDPRDLLGREAVIAFGWGCPPGWILLAFFLGEDNPAMYDVARMAHDIRKSKRGVINTQLCYRGQEASGCASINDDFARAMAEAYETKKVPVWFRQMYTEWVGHRCTRCKTF
jgi:hypothetical protein